MSFLAVDIGNTRLKWALYPQAQMGVEPIASGAEFLNIDKLADGRGPGWPRRTACWAAASPATR